jgi:hypothetical protein
VVVGTKQFPGDSTWPQIVCKSPSLLRVRIAFGATTSSAMVSDLILSSCYNVTIEWRFTDHLPATIGSPTMGHGSHQLRFPPFHRELMAQNHWNASDRMGRIRLELSAGFTHGLGPFNKMGDVVTFAFQPAPMGKQSTTFVQSPEHC